MSYQSMEEAQLRCEKEGIEFWKAVQLEDADERGVTEEASWKEMKRMWQAMLDGLDAYEPELMSRSRMVGREGGLMDAYREAGDTLCGDYLNQVIIQALEMGDLTSSSVISRETAYYTVTVKAGDGGSVFPGGSIRMKEGSSRFFTITPNAGFVVADVKVNGTSVGAVSGYRISSISEDVVLEVSFTLAAGSESQGETEAVSGEAPSQQEKESSGDDEGNNPNTGSC